MSQFSRKYYKNDYQLDLKDPEYKRKREPFAKDGEVWTFWRVWGLYEYLVLGLLLIIIALLLFQRAPAVAPQEVAVVAKTQQRIALEEAPKEIPQSKELTQEDLPKKAEEKEEKAGIYFPKKVLPQNPLPLTKSSAANSSYIPLKMEEYLYFADAVDGFYPAAFDPKNRTIESKSCQNQECPLTSQDISPHDMEAYIQWLEEMTASKYTFVVKGGNYSIKQQ